MQQGGRHYALTKCCHFIFVRDHVLFDLFDTPMLEWCVLTELALEIPDEGISKDKAICTVSLDVSTQVGLLAQLKHSKRPKGFPKDTDVQEISVDKHSSGLTGQVP